MKKLLLCITIFIASQHTKAQSPAKLSLDYCIKLASDSSLQVFKVNSLYLANYWEFRSYKAGRLPSLTLDMVPIQYNREFTKRYDPANNIDVYRNQQSLATSGGLSLSQNVDLTGGRIFLESSLGFFRNFGQTTFSQYSSVPVRLGYTQSLFGFNQFKWDKLIEPLKFQKAKRQFLYAKEEISESVVDLFFALALAKAELDLANENIRSTDTLLAIGQERFKIAGISKAELSTLKLDAINANNTFKKAQIEHQKTMFNLSTYLKLDENQEIQAILPQKPQHLTISLENALRNAREFNPLFLGNQEEIMEAEKELDRIKKGAFKANTSLSIGFNQVANSISEAYKDPIQQNIIGVGFSIPILDWGVQKGKVNIAKNNYELAKISTQQKEQSLTQDIIVTVRDFNIQQDMITSAEEALTLATFAYNETKQRFIIGKSDVNSLMLSLNRQKEAQKNHLLAIKNYWLSFYKIRRITLYDFEKLNSLANLLNKEIFSN